MKFRNNDYFSDLYIPQNAIVSKSMIDDKFEIIKEQAKKKEEQIYDESRRKKSAIYKVDHLDRLEEWISKIEKAYEYCSLPKSILLRNSIVDLNRQTHGINVEVKDVDEQKSSLVMRKTKRDGEYIDTNEFSLLELEKYDLIEGINKLETPLKRYKISLALNWEKLECDFYAEGLDMQKLQDDKRYLQVLLKAIEAQNMQSFREEENIHSYYIGKIECDDLTGNYVVLVSERIKQALHLKRKNMSEKDNAKERMTVEEFENNLNKENRNIGR